MAAINNNVHRITVRLAKEFNEYGPELIDFPLEEMTFFGARFTEVLEASGVDTARMSWTELVKAASELEEVKVGAKRGRKPKSEVVNEEDVYSSDEAVVE